MSDNVMNEQNAVAESLDNKLNPALTPEQYQAVSDSLNNKMSVDTSGFVMPYNREFTTEQNKLFEKQTNYFQDATLIIPDHLSDSDRQQLLDRKNTALSVLGMIEYNMAGEKSGYKNQLSEYMKTFGERFPTATKEQIEKMASMKLQERWLEVFDKRGVIKKEILDDYNFFLTVTPHTYEKLAIGYNVANGEGDFSRGYDAFKFLRPLSLALEAGEIDFKEYQSKVAMVNSRFASTDENGAFYEVGNIFSGMVQPVADNPVQGTLSVLASVGTLIFTKNASLAMGALSLGAWGLDNYQQLQAQSLATVWGREEGNEQKYKREDVLEQTRWHNLAGTALDVADDALTASLIGGTKKVFSLAFGKYLAKGSVGKAQKEFAEAELKDIVTKNPNATWGDILPLQRQRYLDTIASVAGKGTADYAAQVLTETAQDVLANDAAEMVLGTELNDRLSNDWETAKETLKSTLTPMAIISGGMHSVKLGVNLYNVKAYNSQLDGLLKARIAESMVADDPNITPDNIDAVFSQRVYLNKDQLDKTLKANGMTVDDLGEQGRQAYNKAQNGDPIELNTSSYVKLDPKVRKVLNSIATNRAGQLYPEWIRAYLDDAEMDKVRELFNKEQEERKRIKAENEKIEAHVFSQISSANRSLDKKQVQAIANTYSSFYQAMSKVTGKSVDELFSNFQPTVKKYSDKVYSPNVKDIDRNDVRGAYDSSSGVIWIKDSADFSTPLHESVHFFLDVAVKLSAENAELKARVDQIAEWAGAVEDDGTINMQKMQEQFTNGFLIYLLGGKIDPRLGNSIRSLKRFLSNVKQNTALFTGYDAESGISKAEFAKQGYQPQYNYTLPPVDVALAQTDEERQKAQMFNDLVTTMFSSEMVDGIQTVEYPYRSILDEIDSSPLSDETREAIKSELEQAIIELEDSQQGAIDNLSFNQMWQTLNNADVMYRMVMSRALNMTEEQKKDTGYKAGIERALKALGNFRKEKAKIQKQLEKDPPAFITFAENVVAKLRNTGTRLFVYDGELTKEQITALRHKGLLIKKGSDDYISYDKFKNFMETAQGFEFTEYINTYEGKNFDEKFKKFLTDSETFADVVNKAVKADTSVPVFERLRNKVRELDIFVSEGELTDAQVKTLRSRGYKLSFRKQKGKSYTTLSDASKIFFTEYSKLNLVEQLEVNDMFSGIDNTRKELMLSFLLNEQTVEKYKKAKYKEYFNAHHPVVVRLKEYLNNNVSFVASELNLTEEQLAKARAKGLHIFDNDMNTLDVSEFTRYVRDEIEAMPNEQQQSIKSQLNTELSEDKQILDFISNHKNISQLAEDEAKFKVKMDMAELKTEDQSKFREKLARMHKSLAKRFMKVLYSLTEGDRNTRFEVQKITKMIEVLADEDVLNTKFNECRPAEYMGCARLANRHAKEAIAKGLLQNRDTVNGIEKGALTYTRDEVYQNEKAEFAARKKLEILKELASLRRFLKRGDTAISKVYDTDVINLMRLVLGRIGVTKEKNVSIENAKFDELIDKYPMATELIEAVRQFNDIADNLTTDSMFNRYWQEQDIGQLLKIADMMNSIKGLAKSVKDFYVEGMTSTKEERVSDCLASLSQHEDKAPTVLDKNDSTKSGTSKGGGIWSKVGLYMAEFLSLKQAPETKMQDLDGVKIDKNGKKVENVLGGFHKLFTAVRKAYTACMLESNEHGIKLKAIMDNLPKGFIRKGTFESDIPLMIKSEDGKPKKLVLGLGDFKNRMTLEVLGLVLHMGTNYDKLVDGYLDDNYYKGRNDAETMQNKRNAFDDYFREMVAKGIVTKELMKVADAIFKINKTLEPKVNHAGKLSRGYGFAPLESRDVSVTFPDGTTEKYTFGYVPALLNKDMTSVKYDARMTLGENIKNMQGVTGLKEAGFLQERKSNADPLCLDPYVLITRTSDVIRYIHVIPAILQVDRVLNDDRVMQQLNRKFPYLYEQVIQPWLMSVATMKTSTPGTSRVLDSLGNVFNGFVRSTAGALMIGNVNNTLQQYSNIPTVLTKVSPAVLLRYTGMLFWANKEMKETVASQSDFMKLRYMSKHNSQEVVMQDLEAKPELFEDSWEKTKAWYKKFTQWQDRNAYFAQKFVQDQLDTAVWAAAREEGESRGMNKQEQIEYADMVVRTTLGSFDIPDTAKIAKSNPWLKAFAMFGSYFYTMYSLMELQIKQATRQYGISDPRRYLHYMYQSFLSMIAPAVIAELINQSFGTGDLLSDDDELSDSAQTAIFLATPKMLANAFPIVGKAINMQIDEFGGHYFYNSTMLSQPWLTTVSQGYSVLKNLIVDPEHTLKPHEVKAVFMSLAILTNNKGLALLGRPVKAGYGYSSGAFNQDDFDSSALLKSYDVMRTYITGGGHQ